MPKQLPHSQRHPTYDVPYTMVSYNSTGQFILHFALYYEKWFAFDGRPARFTIEDHQRLRVKKIRKDMWYQAIGKLVGFGWITEDDKCYRITPEGIEAAKRVGARNSMRPDRNKLNVD